MYMERLSALAQNETQTGTSPLLWLGIAATVAALIFVLAKALKFKAAFAANADGKFRPSLTAEDVEGIRFPPPGLREPGYEPEQVGQLLEQAARELRRLADEHLRLQQQKADPLSQPVLVGTPVITPDQVVGHKFQTTKKGCSADKVDDFLDRVVLGLREWNAANAQLRSEISGNTVGGVS